MSNGSLGFVSGSGESIYQYPVYDHGTLEKIPQNDWPQ